MYEPKNRPTAEACVLSDKARAPTAGRSVEDFEVYASYRGSVEVETQQEERFVVRPKTSTSKNVQCWTMM